MSLERRLILLLVLASLAAPDPAAAASHLWRFSEFYSSPDQSVQFIEMVEIGGSQIETNISNHWYATNGYNQDHSELLGTDLPFGTAFKRFLVGTESYAALEGVPEPDYVLPDGFLDPDGDTVVWWFYQTLTIPPGVMPSDGVQSLHVTIPPSVSFSTGANSPTNFAGETGSIEPPLVPALPLPPAALAAAAVAAIAWLGLRLRGRGGPRALRRA
jgi:hypothetical protein